MPSPALFTIPREAQFVTVELARAVPAHNGEKTIKQRVVVGGGESLQHVITAAVRGCNRKRVKVGNVIRVTHKDVLLFDYMADTKEAFR